MVFASGRSTKVYVNGWDLTTYFNKANTAESQALYDGTTFGSSYRQYLQGFSDGTLALEGFFDGTDLAVDEQLEAALGAAADGVVLLFPQGDTRGNPGRAALTIQASYEITAPVDGITGIAAALQSDGGFDRVISLHALAAETVAVDTTGVDNTAASTNGGVGYLLATAFSGTSVVIKIQHSTDNVTYTDLITFTAVDAANAYQRVAVTGTVNRYLRASHASGTFTSVTDVVAFGRRN